MRPAGPMSTPTRWAHSGPGRLGLVAMMVVGIAVTVAVANYFLPDATEELEGQTEGAEAAE